MFNDVPEEASIAWTCKGHNNHLLGDSLEVYQLIDVQVNENTDVDVSTLPAGTPAPSYVTRQAPFRIFDALRPVTGTFAARAATEALYVCWSIPDTAEPGMFTGADFVTNKHYDCLD
ncbi:hypothetical protein LQV63_26410 [Paenibacillus profundus]|uniref:Uncharacterized protein n=1 Tax=Paenibacillus profundus TaxID=1173085 RepID=A0ABS8YR23_9BACL|nr:hypothetical protein [Paenibacillus profundus]MCE5172806.1 hypothetical protein [Paenibacillus profundus]